MRAAILRLLILAASGVLADVRPVCAQDGYLSPKSYLDYYDNNPARLIAPRYSAAQYTFDRLYYHNPDISPYINLLRPTGGYVPNYQTYVRPEIERREAMTQPTRITPSYSNPISSPSNLSGEYYNHWYGGREALGLK